MGMCYLLNTVTEKVKKFTYPLIGDQLNKNENLKLNTAKTNRFVKKESYSRVFIVCSVCVILLGTYACISWRVDRNMNRGCITGGGRGWDCGIGVREGPSIVFSRCFWILYHIFAISILKSDYSYSWNKKEISQTPKLRNLSKTPYKEAYCAVLVDCSVLVINRACLDLPTWCQCALKTPTRFPGTGLVRGTDL